MTLDPCRLTARRKFYYYQTFAQSVFAANRPSAREPADCSDRNGDRPNPAAEGCPMKFEARPLILAFCLLGVLPADGSGEDVTPYSGPACRRDGDDYFDREVWDNVAAVRCVQCHEEG